MALQKQTANFSLAGGMQTKIDEKLVEAGKTIELIDGEYAIVGSVNKRKGFDNLNSTTTDNSYFCGNSGKIFLEKQNYFNNEWVQSYEASKNIDVKYPNTVLKRINVNSNGYSSLNCDIESNNGVTRYVSIVKDYILGNIITSWKIENDEATSEVQISPVTYGYGDPSIISAKNGTLTSFFVGFSQGGDFRINRIDSNDIVTSVVFQASAIQNTVFSCTKSDDGLTAYFFVPISALVFRIFVLSESGLSASYSLTLPNPYAFTYTGGKTLGGLDARIDGATIHLTYSNAAGTGFGLVGLSTADPSIITKTVNNYPSNSYGNLLLSVTDVNNLQILSSINAVGVFGAISLKSVIFSKSGAYTFLSVDLIENLYMTSKGVSSIGIESSPDIASFSIQPSLSGSREIICKIANISNEQVAITAKTDSFYSISEIKTSQLPKMAFIENGLFILPKFSVTLPIEDSVSSNFISYAISVDTRNVSGVIGNRASFGRSTYIQGGILSQQYGRNILPIGFLHDPLPAGIESVVAGGSLSAGVYAYKVIYEFIGVNGEISRSEEFTSTGVTVLINQKITAVISSYSFNPKNCLIKTYRTKANGSVYYFEKSYVNSSVGTAVNIEFTAPDATIEINGQIYTQGGDFPDQQPPSCDLIVAGGSRLFINNSLDGNNIWYSKKITYGESASFNSAFSIQVESGQNSSFGKITALGYMDDKLIIFKRDSIFFVTGDGPLSNGSQNTFTDPQLISSISGCTEPRSVITTGAGVFFKGTQGLYLLNRSLVVSDIGDGVAAYDSEVITSASNVVNSSQVRFTTINRTMVYDYLVNKWTTFSIGGIDSEVVNGNMVIRQTGDIILQQGITWQDDGSYYAMHVKTPWIKVTGIQDFSRIWSLYILGKFYSNHSLTASVYYDYDTNYHEDFSFSSTSDPYQFKLQLRKQKCEAIQIIITDSGQSGTGQSMDLTNITMEAGIRKGGFKINPSKQG